MGRRLLFACALAALISASPSAASGPVSWAQPQIKAVLAAGVMTGELTTFRPQDPLTRRTLEGLAAALTHTSPLTQASTSSTVTMAGLDSRLVNTLGLTDAAKLFQARAEAAGLTPPSRFGTEATARLLGLRTNHPASQDDLELLPNEPATRAEAAYSAAQILRFSGGEAQSTLDAAATFTLPQLTPWQRKILATAASLIGYPYVWGGESEGPDWPYGAQAHGGFDCSGFVWRVYKLQRYPDGGKLPDVLRGRTTYALSGEVPKARRISFAKLQPADLLFWGAKGPASQPAQIDHMGIYLGNGWFVHSSRYGVAVAQLSGWYRDRFAWGRRPLAEAGLPGP